MAATSVTIRSSSGDSRLPILVIVEGGGRRTLLIDHSPFEVGRKPEKDLVFTDPRVSREHAIFVSENGDYYLQDLNSRHGTFVNGEKITRRKLNREDKLEFGVREVAYVIFNPQHGTTNSAREFLSQISGMHISDETTDLEKLVLFLEAARTVHRTR